MKIPIFEGKKLNALNPPGLGTNIFQYLYVRLYQIWVEIIRILSDIMSYTEKIYHINYLP